MLVNKGGDTFMEGGAGSLGKDGCWCGKGSLQLIQTR